MTNWLKIALAILQDDHDDENACARAIADALEEAYDEGWDAGHDQGVADTEKDARAFDD